MLAHKVLPLGVSKIASDSSFECVSDYKAAPLTVIGGSTVYTSVADHVSKLASLVSKV